MAMTKFISIDGLDGSGKSTQSHLLCDFLIKRGARCKVLSFPMYDNPSSFGVKMYLDGLLGENPDDTGAYAASMLFAADRYISYRTEWGQDLQDFDYVIFNRYVSANAVHQLSKLPREKWDEFLSWLCDFEFVKLGLPRPCETLYLVVPPEISLGLVGKRSDATGQAKDIHEKSAAYMRDCYDAGLYAAKKLGWKIIDCTKDGQMLEREKILSLICGSVI